MDSLISATGDSPASGTMTPALQEPFKGSGFPASCQNQGDLAPLVKPKVIPPAPPDSQSSPGTPRVPLSPARGPALCCRPSDAEAVTAISLLISNLSAPKHAWTDISADNWENQDLSLCKELLFQGCIAEGGDSTRQPQCEGGDSTEQPGRESGYIMPGYWRGGRAYDTNLPQGTAASKCFGPALAFGLGEKLSSLQSQGKWFELGSGLV